MYSPFKFLTTVNPFNYNFDIYSIKFNQSLIFNPSEIFYFKNLFFFNIPDFTELLLSFKDKNKILNLFNYQTLTNYNDINFVYSTVFVDYLYYLNNITSISYNFDFTNNFDNFFSLFFLKTIFNNNNFYKFLPINIFNNQIITYSG